VPWDTEHPKSKKSNVARFVHRSGTLMIRIHASLGRMYTEGIGLSSGIFLLDDAIHSTTVCP
jgi:hypothetical protein